uniref:hypothetical protein n=1 Tax=Alistipes sp. TaxID=1872444 RepID=UPI0040571C96
MKKALIILAILSASFSAHGQLAYEDFRNNQEFTYYGTVYRLYNPSYHLSEKMREKGKYVRLKSVANEKFEHLAVYTDGSTAQDLDEIQNVVKYAPNDRFILYHAMRNVFSLEELNENSKAIIFFNMVIDNQGIILETSVGFPIKGSYVIQPQQIAALETMIRKNLTFVLDQEKAAKFNYFQGEVWLRFGDFIEEPTS